MSTMAIRPYAPADRQAVEDICFATGFLGESAARYWPHRRSFLEVWLDYYTLEEPESLLVATVDGKVVGYLAGCLGVAGGPRTGPRMDEAIFRNGLVIGKGMTGFFVRAMWDIVVRKSPNYGDFVDQRWPSHLRINLMSEARRLGLGRQLVRAWQDRVRAAGSSGCHLGVVVENQRAIRFFEGMGFCRHGEPQGLPGMRGRSGMPLSQQIMVWEANAAALAA